MLLVYTMVLCLLILRITRVCENRKRICIICCVALLLITVLKGISPTSDLMIYEYKYAKYASYSIGKLFSLWIGGYEKDGLFYIIGKIFAEAGAPFVVWSSVIGAFWCVSFCRFIYKYSSDPILSTIMNIALYLYFTLSGLRQTVALGFLLIAYDKLQNRKVLSFILLVIVSSMFHSSTLIALTLLPLFYVRMRPNRLFYIIVSAVIVLLVPNIIRESVAFFSWSDYLTRYSTSTVGLNWTGTIIALSVLLVCLFVARYYDGKEHLNAYNDKFLNAMTAGVCFEMFSTIIAEIFRVAYYFNIGNTVVLPNVLENAKVRTSKTLLCVSVYFIFVLYIVISGQYEGYVYLWETNFA